MTPSSSGEGDVHETRNEDGCGLRGGCDVTHNDLKSRKMTDEGGPKVRRSARSNMIRLCFYLLEVCSYIRVLCHYYVNLLYNTLSMAKRKKTKTLN
jgi:hypothetical protein